MIGKPSLPLSAHIGYLFLELPLEKRIRAARVAGFQAIEHPDPQSIQPARLRALLHAEGLGFAQMAAGLGDPVRGDKGLAALPGRETAFRDSLMRSLDYAEFIGCPLVHPMAGITSGNERASDTYLENLGFAVQACRGRPVSILIEAISTAAVPGYFMSTLEHALAVSDAIGPDEVSLLVDSFHAAANGTDTLAFLEAHPNRVGHVHIADHPGRHEPGTGTIDFKPILDFLVARGYRGAVGLEYIPSVKTEQSISWLAEWRRRLDGATTEVIGGMPPASRQGVPTQ